MLYSFLAVQVFSGRCEQGLLFVAEHRLWVRGFQWLCCLGLVVSQYVDSSRTRDWTCVRSTGRQILNHWTIMEVPWSCFSCVDQSLDADWVSKHHCKFRPLAKVLKRFGFPFLESPVPWINCLGLWGKFEGNHFLILATMSLGVFSWKSSISFNHWFLILKPDSGLETDKGIMTLLGLTAFRFLINHLGFLWIIHIEKHPCWLPI